MASSKFQIVVQGEASETDSDEEVYITSHASVHASGAGLKVPGEASETDSEEEADRDTSHQAQVLRRDLPPLIVVRNTPELFSGAEEKQLSRPEVSGHCNTLLQQKLQESNARLCSDVTQALRQVYSSATRDIRLATTNLNNSQNGIINASHSIRLILEDLKSVSEKMEIITSCNLLPDISMPASPTP